METPVGRSRNRGTPGSSRLRSAVKTRKSVLTPNDDAAEKASVRRKRRSEALRLSLSDAFAGHADQHSRQQQQAGAGGSSKPTLSEEARTMLLEQCLKLASENKINDRNAWSLDLITHLPDIVGSGPSRAQQSHNNSTYNFQKMSGGLDAGVTIYSKRVDLTYRSAMNLGSLGPKQQGGDGEDGYENEGVEEDDGLDDAAAAAAKAQKQKGGRARQGDSADEEATLTTPDHLRAKKGDSTFAVDPLFHTMSALFDEGGAKGLLLLNRSVYDGAHIMTSPQGIPEQQFPLQQQPQQDTLLDLRPLQQQLVACSSSSGGAGGGSKQGNVAVLTPGLPQLYALLEETRKALPGHKQQQQACSGPDVGSIMQQALRNLPPQPMPKRVHTAQAAAAAATAGTAAADADMADADIPCETFAASPGADGTAEMQYNSNIDSHDSSSSSSGGGDAAEGPSSGGVPIVASFLASCEAAADEDAAAAADESYGAEYSGCEDDGHPGYGDGGDSSWGHQQQQQQQDRRQSLLGLGGAQDYDESSGLDAEALQQLLGAAGGSGKGGTMAGSGWAGSRFWKYRSAAAAAARMASGSSGGAVKRATAGASASKGRSGSYRIDFTSRPADLSAALAPGDPKKIRLVTAPSSSTADTLLPEDLHYQASSLLQLFLRPSPINFSRQRQGGAGPAAGTGAHDSELPTWAEEGGDEGCSWGGADDGNEYDGDGAEGYNAGDLSMGDPGFSAVDGSAGGAGGEWWSPEGELLSAPKRMAGGGVRYQRSAKQVDVRALKDLLWDSLINVNTNIQTTSNSSSSADATSPQGTSAAAAAPVIPFQDVIVNVPSDSAAGAIEDVSVHMCFICLLHLANERGLVVRAQEDLKTLTISNVQQEQQSQQRPAH